MRTSRREAARSVGLLLAMLAGLMLARWGLAGGLSRPLIPATPTPPPAAGAAPAAGIPELRGHPLYLGGRQPLVADAGGGPSRPLRTGMAGRTSVLRQGRYLVVRVAEQLEKGPVLALATGGPEAAATPLGSALEVLPSPRPDRVWLLDRRARSPQRAFTLQEVELATGRRLAVVALPHDAEPVAMVDDGVLVRDLRAGLAVRDLASGRERQRLGTDLTFVDATARLVAYVDDRGGLRLRDLATRRDRVVRPTGMPNWFPMGRPVAGAGCCDQFGAFSADGRRLADGEPAGPAVGRHDRHRARQPGGLAIVALPARERSLVGTARPDGEGNVGMLSNASSLLGQLTLEEKASLCLGSDFWHTAPVERLGIPAIMVSDGPHGLRRQPEEGDHVGISGSVPATCFPTACALASSWNPPLVRRVGEALGREARVQDVAVVLGPGINIKRSPLCGRNFEYLSEDPALSGVLGAAMIDGVQSQGVGTSLKHFAANNQETDRLRVSADVDERTLREIYLAGFERAVTQARPWTVMCSYNKVNGVHASQNAWLLTTILRNEWGFDGLVVSDWGAVHDRVAALAAGLDLEMPPNRGVSDAAIVAAVRTGQLDESVLDAAVARVLRLVDRAAANTEPPPVLDPDAHHALARAAATECAVLLKNEDRLLPLRPAAGDTIAVIGELARTPRYQGAGSSQVNPTRVDVALDELRAAVPDQVEIAFAAGYGVDTTDRDEQLAAEAVALAGRADAVVAFLGLPAADESEGFDRSHMDLPASQTALLARLADTNPNLAVVLANGSVVRLSDWEQHAKAVLECWLSGQAAGGAAADLLLGAANPSGRLAETLPLRLEDTPSYLNFPGEAGHVRYGEGIFVGYRGYDALDRQVSYPFGHGLSYTSFGYTDLATNVTGRHQDGDLVVEVTCRVANTGDRCGSEVVQLYVRDPEASVARPVRELKAFAKVDLDPGETAVVELALTARDLSYWSTSLNAWVLEGGEFELAVGASSRDLRLTTTLDIAAPPLPASLDGMSTLQEWLADPTGSALLHKAIGIDATGRPKGILGNEELMIVIGNFPISTLAAFPGLGLSHAVVHALIDQRSRSERGGRVIGVDELGGQSGLQR